MTLQANQHAVSLWLQTPASPLLFFSAVLMSVWDVDADAAACSSVHPTTLSHYKCTSLAILKLKCFSTFLRSQSHTHAHTVTVKCAQDPSLRAAKMNSSANAHLSSDWQLNGSGRVLLLSPHQHTEEPSAGQRTAASSICTTARESRRDNQP